MTVGDSGQGKRFGAYVIHGEIARGGQGAVLQATHEPTGQRVALKLLLERSHRSQKRFKQEAEVLSRLRHPNLLRVTDHGDWNGMVYMAMEFVDGEDLSVIVKTRGIPDPAWSAGILADVADALEHCHGQGVVHRDLKPANVLIERDTGRTVLVDFGMIKRDPELLGISILDDGTRFSKTGELKGTPAFMAPEQVNPAKFGDVSPRTDVYALGGTLFHLLTGRPPFEGDMLPSLLVAVLSADPPDPRQDNPSVPSQLARICLQCLAKSPDERPPSAAAVAQALRSAGTPDGQSAPSGRWPLAVSLALNLLLLVALGWALGATAPGASSWEDALRLTRAGESLTEAELKALEAQSAGRDWARWLPYVRVQGALRAAEPDAHTQALALAAGPERDLLVAEASLVREGEDLRAAFELLEEGAAASLPWRKDSAAERWLALAAAAAAQDDRDLAARAYLRAALAGRDREASLRAIERAFALDAYAAARAGEPLAEQLLNSAQEALAGPAEVAKAQAYAQARRRLFLWRLIRPAASLPTKVLEDLRRLGDTADRRIARGVLPGLARWKIASGELFEMLSKPFPNGGVMASAGGTKIPELPSGWQKWVQRANNQALHVTGEMLEECLLWRPDGAVLWYQLARTRERGGNYDSAARIQEVALTLEKTDRGWAEYRLGNSLQLARRYASSVEVLLRSIEFEGSHHTSTAQWAGLSLARSYLHLGKPAKALAALDDLEGSWMATQPNALLQRFEALSGLGRAGEADLALQRYLGAVSNPANR